MNSVSPYAPKAWLLADFSDSAQAQNFIITKSHTEIADEFKQRTRTSNDNLTGADKLIQTLNPQMRDDPIAGEDFSTVFEANIKSGSYGSLHYMILGGKGEQKFHYHPPGNYISESSQRHVLLYPLWNEDQNEGGIVFEWFGITDSRLVQPEQDIFPHVEGTMQSPLYRLELQPGQVALVTFGKGVHRFKGHALAMSGHFLDIYTGNQFGSFLGNTAGWNGQRPEEAMDVNIMPTQNRGEEIELASIFSRHAEVMKGRIAAHVSENPGQALTEADLSHLVEELRL